MVGGDEIQNDGWLRATRYVLIFTGACYLLVIGPVIIEHKFHDAHMSPDFTHALEIGARVVMLAVCGGAAALNFAAAWGLARGKKWAWIMALVLGGLYAPSICMPLGGVILYGLLREPVRRRYLDGPATPG